MKHSLKQSLAITLALLMMLALAAPALAAPKNMIVTASAQVRSTPSQSPTNIIGTLSKNTTVTQTGTTGIWSIIDYNGGTAYVLSSRLSTYAGGVPSGGTPGYPSSGGTGSTVYATAAVNVRKGPGSNYGKAGQLQQGSAVKKVGSTGSWTIIEWNDGVAYVSSSYLTGSGSGSSGSTGSATSSDRVQATANVNLRSGPGTNYSIVGWLAKGEIVDRVGSSGKWTIVRVNGSNAYVSSAYVQYTSSGSSSSGNSNTSNNNYNDTLLYARVATSVYAGPGSSNRVVGYLDPGQSVVFLDTYGSWYRVQYGSYNNVYVYAADMRWGGANTEYSVSGYVYANTSVPVYASASTGSNRLGYLYAGDSAQRIATAGSFTRIYYGNTTGYVVSSQVTFSNTGLGSMSIVNAWMYSRYNGAVCYTSPMESNSYRHGTLGMYERVWAVEGNSTWTKIQVTGGYTVYTLTSNLAYDYPGQYPSGTNPGAGTGNGYVMNATRLFSDPADPVGGFITTIPAYSQVTFLLYNKNMAYAQVRYYDSSRGISYDGWVYTNDVKVY